MATVLLATGLIVTQQGTAAAASTYCQVKATPYHWTQESCVDWMSTRPQSIRGFGTIQFTTGFNRDHVIRCRLHFQLKSSYGTLTPDDENVYKCDDDAALGGGHTYPADSWPDDPQQLYQQDWGFGRRSGDRYTQYVWMEVWTTSGLYDGRPWAAQATLTRP